MNDNKPMHWNDIPKKKISQFKKKPLVSYLLNMASKNFEFSKPVLVLERIYKKNSKLLETNQPLTPHKDLYSLLHNKDLLRLAFRKLSKNKGANTPGPDGITVDNISEAQIEELSNILKNHSFKWSPVRRIMIPKPGKPEKRPLGLPDFHTKMVQEVIRMILEVIYEPEFRFYDSNSGFRPKRDCHHAIRNIRKKAQFADYVIEGDIVGAYNNVNHHTLIEILKLRISDRKFLEFLHDGFRAGIVEDYIFHDSLLGVPQGGICSPILFNIYMHELDKYILNTLQVEIERANESSNVVEITSEYSTLKSRRGRLKEKLSEFQEAIKNNTKRPQIQLYDKVRIIKNHPSYFPNVPFINNITELEQKLINQAASPEKADKNANSTERAQLRRKLTPEQNKYIEQEYVKLMELDIKILTAEMRKTPSLDIDRKRAKIYYHRYADDWTIWVRGNQQLAEWIKTKVATFLKEKLQLELSPTKTAITKLDENKATFLGFEIYFPRNPILRKKNHEGEYYGTSRVRAIQIAPDEARLQKKFITKGFADKSSFKAGKRHVPRELGWLTVLEDHQIIEKYNQFMIGFGTYYIAEINSPSLLGKWHYLIYYSCIKTLAAKHRLSTKSIIKKYGLTDLSIPTSNRRKGFATDIRIAASYLFNNEKKWNVLINYKEFMFLLNKYKETYNKKINTGEEWTVPPIDFSVLHKSNLRTKYKNTSHCSICGSTNRLQNHHIKAIKHSGGRFTGYGGFDRLVASLGRKQITVCFQCHQSIHRGQYRGIGLEDLYDVRSVAPESYIRFDQATKSIGQPQPGQKKSNKDPWREYEVDELRKTYYNKAFKNSFPK